MTRVAVTLLGLTAWLAGALGLRAWLGAKTYVGYVVGPQVQADAMLAKALEQPELLLLGMDPWTLLLAASAVVSAALVLVVLTPVDLLLRRLRVDWRARVAVGAALGAVAAGSVLLSIHPLLSRPTVPEGPRTVLNFACEAAGYGWVNAIAYLGAIGAGVGLAAWGRRAQARAQPPAPPAEPSSADHAEPGDSSDEGSPPPA